MLSGESKSRKDAVWKVLDDDRPGNDPRYANKFPIRAAARFPSVRSSSIRRASEIRILSPVCSYRFCRVARPSRLYSSLQRGLFERLTVDLCLIYAPPRSLSPPLSSPSRKMTPQRRLVPLLSNYLSLSPSRSPFPRHVGKSRHN